MQKSDDFLEKANSVKVLAFMEVAPLTDKFEQIALTEAQARKMRDALFAILCPAAKNDQDYQQFNVVTNDDVRMTLPDVRDSYGKDFFDKEENKQQQEAD